MRNIKSALAIALLLSGETLLLEKNSLAQMHAQVTPEKVAVTSSNAKNNFANVLSTTFEMVEEPPPSTPVSEALPPSGAAEETPPTPAAPEHLPLRNAGKPSELERAYFDAFTILAEETKCSSFLGGPLSISALNELVKQLKPTLLQGSVAVKMTGPITTYQNNRTGAAYRLFKKAELNLEGAFYRSRSSINSRVPWVGDFAPNTREARVTVLLHELGHLVQGADKLWVLPDDGNDPALSRENTRRIIEACGKRIKEVSRLPFRDRSQ